MSLDSVLPAGWARTSLGEVANVPVEQSGPTGNSDFVYVDISGIDRERKFISEPKVTPVAKAPSRARQMLKAGDVVVSMTRPNLNAVALVLEELDGAIGSTGFRVLRTSHVNPAWIAYLVQTKEFVSAMSSLVLGVLYPAVRPKDIDAYEFALPPRREQDRIVDEIEKQLTGLEAGVSALKRVQANLKRYRASVLKAACEGRLVPTEAELARKEGRSYEPGSELLERILHERRANWEADQLARMIAANKPPNDDSWKRKYKEPESCDTSKLAEPPEGWTWTSLDQLTSDPQIGLDRGRQFQNTSPVGAPYLKMNNVTMDGKIVLDDLVYVAVEEQERRRFGVSPGDLLFNTRNSVELVGKVGVVKSEVPGAVYNNNLMRIRLNSGADPRYVCAHMCSDEFRGRMELVKRSTTNVAAVYAKDLFPLAVALPPHAEQLRIVEYLETQQSLVDELNIEIERSLGRAVSLRQSILKQAFEGKLVPQDPNDEPASVLLERIRAERAVLKSLPKRTEKKRKAEPAHA